MLILIAERCDSFEVSKIFGTRTMLANVNPIIRGYNGDIRLPDVDPNPHLLGRVWNRLFTRSPQLSACADRVSPPTKFHEPQTVECTVKLQLAQYCDW